MGAENTSKCKGCNGVIHDNEKDIVEILCGTIEDQGDEGDNMLIVQPDKTLWLGHKKCFDERFRK